jgi:photosystem II stability/assembly factor-like uncharacterized protein
MNVSFRQGEPAMHDPRVGFRWARELRRWGSVLALAAGVGGGQAALAQVRWTPVGPAGGPVQAVAIAADGRTVYAGISGGLVSRKRGSSWLPPRDGLRGTLFDLQNAAVAPGTVYVLTSAGVFASFDAARSWQARSNGLPDGPFDDPLLSLEVAPSNPAVLYVIARRRPGELSGVDEQVYRSLNGGASWARADRGLPNPEADVFDLAVDPARSRVAFAATSTGVFKTTNGGGRWARSGLDGSRVSVVAVDRVRPGLVYAVAAAGFDGPLRIQVSADGGRTWSDRSEAFAAVALEPHPGRAETVHLLTFAGDLLESDDAGRTWRPIDEGLGDLAVRSVAADPLHPAVLYAAVAAPGTDPGVYHSADGGATWRPLAAGIVASGVTSLAFQAGDIRAVYAGIAGDGLQRLDIATGAWTQLAFDRQTIVDLAVDPQAPATFYALVGPDRALFQSTDSAVTWRRLSSTEPSSVFYTGLAVADGRVWLAGNIPEVWDPATGTFERLGLSERRQIARAGAGPTTRIWWNDSTFLDAGGGFDQVDASRDAGATFERVLAGIAGEVLDIALLDGDADRVALAVGAPGLGRYQTGFVQLSDDGGATWRLTALPNAPAVHQVVLDPADPERVLAATLGAVYESLDGGASWRNLGRGLPGGALITELAFDQVGRLYAATGSGGVYRLRDQRP